MISLFLRRFKNKTEYGRFKPANVQQY